MAEYRYLFGPVPSRRLGRSLGVDLIPFKTCTFNCVYCQLGRTPHVTLERKAYVPIEAVLGELADWKSAGGQADVVTLAGSGEPTLHTEFGRVLVCAREELHLPSVLLTNGTLLHLEDVCDQASRADIVKVTLSAWDDGSLQTLHHPHLSIRFRDIYEGEKKLRHRMKGQFWVEVFLVGGVNTDPYSLAVLSRLVKELHPDRIHVNTAVRPAAERDVTAVTHEVLEKAANILGPAAEIVASTVITETSSEGITVEAVYRLIERHPCSAQDLECVFNASSEPVEECLNELLQVGRIIRVERGNTVYYGLPTLNGERFCGERS